MTEAKKKGTKNNGPLGNKDIIALAWRITGGTKNRLKSFDCFLALAITLLCMPAWTKPGWWEMPISIMPSFLGFTLGGFAIFLGFGSDSFKTFIANSDHEKSEYLSVSSSFLIFVIFQIISLIYSIIAKSLFFPAPLFLSFINYFSSYINPIFWFLGFFIFIYSILLGLKSALRIFRVSRWYNDFLLIEEQERK